MEYVERKEAAQVKLSRDNPGSIETDDGFVQQAHYCLGKQTVTPHDWQMSAVRTILRKYMQRFNSMRQLGNPTPVP